MARRPSDARPRLAADQPDNIARVKLSEHETAGTMAVALRSLASQLERYPRDRRVTGFRIMRDTREVVITLESGGEKA
nr:MAG: hypothetical protein DIU74_12415 [Pseudomonadota bacterium]